MNNSKCDRAYFVSILLCNSPQLYQKLPFLCHNLIWFSQNDRVNFIPVTLRMLTLQIASLILLWRKELLKYCENSFCIKIQTNSVTQGLFVRVAFCSSIVNRGLYNSLRWNNLIWRSKSGRKPSRYIPDTWMILAAWDNLVFLFCYVGVILDKTDLASKKIHVKRENGSKIVIFNEGSQF